MHAEPVRAEAAGHLGERVHVHHTRAQFGQLTLGLVRVLLVQPLGDAQAQDGVAEELQPLVGRQPTILVRVRAMGQRQTQQVRLHLDAESGEQAGMFTGRIGFVGHVDTTGRSIRSPR